MIQKEEIIKAAEEILKSSCRATRQGNGWKILTTTRPTEKQGNEIVKLLGMEGKSWSGFFTLNPPEQGLFLEDD